MIGRFRYPDFMRLEADWEAATAPVDAKTR
jgi:hypothetical protein